MKTIKVKYKICKYPPDGDLILEDEQTLEVSDENYEEIFEWEKGEKEPFAYKTLSSVLMNIAILKDYYQRLVILSIEGENEIKEIEKYWKK